MSITDFTASIALAKKLIMAKGESITIRRPTPDPPADPSKPWRPGVINYTEFSSYGLFLPNGIRGPFTLARHRDSDVTSSDIICYIPGDALWTNRYLYNISTGVTTVTVDKSLRLELTDVILTAHGITYSIGTTDYFQPAGDPVYYEARLKR